MQMAEQFDISTLAWVKGEIDETLKQARIALERYVEDPNDEAQLQFCITYIHQVYGTLHMVELDGAAMFAEEMEQFGSAIQQGQIENKDQAYELLMRAILQLPDYLESLLAGQGDNPVGLVPLLNELREQRGDKALDSAAFFRPNLSVIPPARKASPPAGVNSSVAAQKLHRYYMAGLAKIIKGTDVEPSLKALATVIDKLMGVADADRWRRLLWVTSAFIESLRNNAIAVSRETKPLLGKVEQQIKAVSAKGESSLSDDVLAKILQPMLYLLAKSEGTGAVSTAVRDAFDLQRYMPQDRGGLGGINAELKQTVSADIMDELSSVKDTFDVFVRSDRTSTSNLEPMIESLSRMAETLNLLQEEALRESLQKQVTVIRQLLAGEVEANDETLMGIAGAILAVESALRDWGTSGPLVKADASEEQVSDTENSPEAVAEHQRVTRQVMKEARDDLIRIREAINNYLENPEDKAVLDNLPTLLHMIIGSLTLLSYKRVAQVLTSCSGFIQDQLIGSSTIPEGSKLDALADAVMSVEYYLEAFVQSRVHPSSVLDVAENAVANLGYAVGTIVEPQDQVAEEVLDVEGIEVFESHDDEQQQEGLAAFAEPTPITLEEEGHDELEEFGLFDGTKAEVEPVVAEEIPSAVEAPAPAVTPAPSVKESRQAAPVEVDDEILEIFIEEAEEELQNIRTLLPEWMANPAADESLKDLRRSFHTLKGSGRLVGANELGEFAWAFENMLNRVIDGTVGYNAAMFDLLEQAADALPELIAQFKDGVVPHSDIAMLHEMAFEISQPSENKPSASVAETTPAANAEAVAAEPSKIAEIPELDPVLLEIYSKESEGHLDELDSYVQHVNEGGSRKVTEPLIRALHTLQGSSRMAGIISIADVCAKLEKYAKTLQASNEVIDADGIEALEECTRYIRAMLAFLTDTANQRIPDNTTAQKLADDVYIKVQHLEHVAHAQPEAGLATIELESEALAPSLPTVEEIAFDDALESVSEPEELGFDALDDFDIQEAFEVITEVQPEPEPAEEAALEIEPVPQQAVTGRADYSHISDDVADVEEYDPELLEIFLEEGADILDASEETLQAWVNSPEDRSLVEALQRQLHTLKGGARMAGIKPIGDLSHSLESTFDGVVDGLLQRSPAMIDLLQLSHDRLVTMLEQVRRHEPVTSGGDLIAQVEALARGEELSSPAIESDESLTFGELQEDAAARLSEMSESAISLVPSTIAEAPEMSGFDAAVADVEFNLSAWVRDVNDRELFENLYQAGIELDKECGSVRSDELEQLTSAISALLSSIMDGHVAASKKASDLLMLALDRLRLMMSQLKEQQPLDNSQFVVEDINDLISSSIAEAGKGDKVVAIDKAREEQDKSAEEADNRRKAPRIQQEVVRVRADLLDNLVNFAGEVSIYRSRVEQQIGSFRSSIDEMDQTVNRLREQVRQFDIETEAQIESRKEEAQKMGYEDFDPLEFDRFTHMQQLSRSMVESLSDLVSIEDMFLTLTRESETLLLQQSRVNTELQESLMHTRMVPLAEYAPRLRRIVRQTSSELSKRTNLAFHGAEVEMDRNVVERMMAPLEHMLRNSIAHGIEDKKSRLKAGKAEEGSINIALSREGSEVIVRVSDDGAGINLDAVKKKAVERGLIKEGTKLSDKEIMGFILESGFSTAQSLSQISGRGVGMDVVNSEIKQLGGVLEIDSTPGKGTVFTVRLPLTLSVSRALLVNVGEDIYAIPLMSISGIERISPSELEALLNSENPVFAWVGEEYEVMHLTGVLGAGTGQIASDSGKLALLLAKSGDHRIAFAIDGLIGSREIVVKSLGPQLSTLKDLAGATILADGSVALIIDMPSLIRRGLSHKGSDAASLEVIEHGVEKIPVVMVVDDSITVRKVTERLLKRHNMKCVTAKDGVDALTVLEETVPDVMLLDIEMPRMDGFELATHIRNSERLKDIPIIMITSRTGEKHRQRALDIGVNKYMGKPYTEVDLLDNIESLIQE